MKKFIAISTFIFASVALATTAPVQETSEILFTPEATSASVFSDTDPTVVASGCFLKGERSSGMNKICYYNCVGGERAITIGATELCPLSL